MIRKLVILGAGFDVPAGLPTMLGFIPTVWDLVGRNYIGDHTGFEGYSQDLPTFFEIRRLWQAWRARPETRCDSDLEEFAVHIEAHHWDHIPDLRYVIARTLDLAHHVWRLPHERWFGHPSWEPTFRAFAADVLRHHDDLAVLSFNYSLIFDQALRQVGGWPCCKLDRARPINHTEPSSGVVDVLKPHGSINWLVPVEGRARDIVVDYTPGPKDTTGQWWKGAGNWQTSWAYHDEDGSPRMPLIVPPADKPTAVEGPYSSERGLLAPVYARLQEILPEVDSCFIAGWSAPLTDAHIFHQLSGLKERCTRVTVLNMDGKQLRDLQSHYRKLLPDNPTFAWDFGGMRAAENMPLWKCFLES